jgi:hypothetical protein
MWRLDAGAAELKVIMIGDAAAQIYVPIMFSIGALGQPAQPTRFLMNLVGQDSGDRFALRAVIAHCSRHVCFVSQPDHAQQQSALFDHLVGAGEQQARQIKA